MNSDERQNIAQLEEQFDSANELKTTLRVSFNNGEIYDLVGFFMGQDNDEEWPHCYTTVVRVVHAEERKRELFKPETAMMFHLNDVEAIEQLPQETNPLTI